jgi:arginase family enzyme
MLAPKSRGSESRRDLLRPAWSKNSEAGLGEGVSERAAIFGAALDLLEDPERLSLKRSYLEACREGRVPSGLPRDPYDAILPPLLALAGDQVVPAGKVDVPSWITPRPLPADLEFINPRRYREFMDTGGPALVARSCGQRALACLPAYPVMIAVDHALSAGPISALSAKIGPENLAVVVLDSHFDAVPAADRAAGMSLSFHGRGHCGDFLADLLNDGVIRPRNLLVAGVSDYPEQDCPARAFTRSYRSWIERGVKVYPKSQVRAPGFLDRFRRDLMSLSARRLYVSLDADAGAGGEMAAVRFMDCLGLTEAELLAIARGLRELLDDGGYGLAGVDVCEVDVHLLGLAGPGGAPDRTAEICARFLAALLGCRVGG